MTSPCITKRTVVPGETRPSNLRAALIKAIQDSDLDRVTLLLDEDPSLIDAKDDAGLNISHTAAMYGYSRRTEVNKPIIDLLLERGLEPDIFACAYLRMHDAGNQLIASDPECVGAIAPNGSTALHFATEIGDLVFTRVLVEAGADVESRDKRGETPLLKALHAGPWKPEPADDIVEYLLSQGGSVTVHTAAAMGDIERLKVALDASPDRVDEPDDKGATPLYHAARNNRPEAVTFLLERGADVNKPSNEGRTPVSEATLHTLSQECDLDMLQGLVDAGAEYGIRTAIALNDVDRTETLLAENPELANNRDNWGPIHYAIHTWKPHIIKLLIQRGCELTEEDIGHIRRIADKKGVSADDVISA